MIPLGAFVSFKETTGPDRESHYNGVLTAEINGGPAPGYSTGQAQKALEDLAKQELPNGMGFEWTELTYQQILAGNTAIYVFPLCVLLAFLVLVAQYESWTLPLVVILIVPMTLLSALAGVLLTHGDNNIFTQIGLIVLVGLACKNAILIVEFAKEREEHGDTPLQAVLEACRLRLRPILMTSIAFIMGVGPWSPRTGPAPRCAGHGRGGVLRHAGGDGLRPDPDPDLLLRDPPQHRPPGGPEGGSSTTDERRPTPWRRTDDPGPLELSAPGPGPPTAHGKA
jgi:multidrug efflux pump